MQSRLEISSNPGFWGFGSLLVLPGAFLVAAFWAQTAGGPFWLRGNFDPDYFYLLDALNIINLTTPGHVYHPGTTVDWLAALVLKAAYPLTGADAIINTVIADPEFHLRLIGTVFLGLNGLGVLALGVAGYRVFRELTSAWCLQIAPFVSMLVLKNSYHVKPEALLLLTGLVLTALSVMALKPGLLDRFRARFAIGYGIIAGFGVATKITALPVFLLPVFVLGVGGGGKDEGGLAGGVRAIGLYGLASLLALIVFTLPAAGAYDVFFAWMSKVSQGTGAYGGEGGAQEWTVYPANILKLFKRPVFHVVFVLSGLMLAVAAWRRRQAISQAIPPGVPLGGPQQSVEFRLLLGLWVSQLAHVAMVAKQPNVLYLVPTFVLIPLAFVLVWRLGREMIGDRRPWDRLFRPGLVLVLAFMVVAQGFSVSRLINESGEKTRTALSVDAAQFDRCARIYAYAASSRSYALLLGDYVTGSKFAGRLAAQGPDNDYWLEHWWDQSRLVFRGWRGPEDMAQVLARYPCSVFRGSHWKIIDRLLPETLPGVMFDADCSAGKETILTRGVGCDGRLLR